MSTLLWDASAAMKLVVVEPGTDAAIARFAEHQHSCILGWTGLEVASALWKRARRAEVESTAVTLAFETFRRLAFDVVDVGHLEASALRLALDLKHPVCDCLYLVAAAASNAKLVTSDMRLRALAERVSVETLWVGAES